MNNITGDTFALQAQSEKYTGIPYSKLDCQAFVEKVLADCQVTRPDGTLYNWKGSNSMWRNALSWKGTIQDCLSQYGEIPKGSWVFIVKNDGGEKDRGYNDTEGNATHVGIYCDSSLYPVRDSTKTKTRDGVGYRKIDGFTHVGFPKMIRFNITDVSRAAAVAAVSSLRNSQSSDETILQSLITLTNYIRGVNN